MYIRIHIQISVGCIYRSITEININVKYITLILLCLNGEKSHFLIFTYYYGDKMCNDLSYVFCQYYPHDI